MNSSYQFSTLSVASVVVAFLKNSVWTMAIHLMSGIMFWHLHPRWCTFVVRQNCLLPFLLVFDFLSYQAGKQMLILYFNTKIGLKYVNNSLHIFLLKRSDLTHLDFF